MKYWAERPTVLLDEEEKIVGVITYHTNEEKRWRVQTGSRVVWFQFLIEARTWCKENPEKIVLVDPKEK